MIHSQENAWGWLGWIGPYVYETRGCIAIQKLIALLGVPLEVKILDGSQLVDDGRCGHGRGGALFPS